MSKSNVVRATTSKGLILIVDDEQTICSTLQSVLEDESFSTITANSGLDAILKVQSFFPDIVFLDIWMPGSDGIETLEKIKAVSPHTEVIMISGHATISNALEATKRGAFDFIEKPLSIQSVLIAATRALEKNNSQETIIEESKKTTPAKTGSSFQHPGIKLKGQQGRNLGQRTLKKSAILYGHCLHSGEKSGLVLEPLPPDSGIHFSRIGDSKTVPAYIDFVKSTDLATTLSLGNIKASTIEHLMATLCAYKISNLLIKCNGEVPIFDGSAIEFCNVIESVGIEEQPGSWHEIAISERINYKTNLEKRSSGVENQNEEYLTIEPADDLIIRYELNYPAPIGKQSFEFSCSNSNLFKEQIASARTFGFIKDIEKLQKAGLAAGGRLDNFILIDDERIVNTQLRFPEELARHKILDILGDLFLIGRPLRAKITAHMTGHSDNINILRNINEILKKLEIVIAKES